MPKLFCVSDIHSYYDPLIEALNEAGFDRDNPEHYLIVLGDVFDRGDQSAEVLRFLRRLEHKVLIKGNHCQLLLEACEREYPAHYDYGNGTYKTICDIGGAGEGWSFDECCIRTLARVSTFIDGMENYLETEHYIFVHGWLPVNYTDSLPAYYRKNRRFSSMEDFRKATQKQWDEAAWICGPDMAMDGYNNTGKIVVFGHWHTSYLWSVKDGRSEFGDDAKFDIFYGKDFIAIDGCTAHSGKVNVLVLEDEFL